MRQHLSRVALSIAFVATACIDTTPAEFIVMNDENIFDNTAATDPNNVQLYKNLVNVTTTGARAQARTVLIHLGHGYGCASLAMCYGGAFGGAPPFETTLTNEGYTVLEGNDATAPLTAIGPDVKVIFLMTPNTGYSDAEIASLKKFLADSGRLVLVGENEFAWGANGIAIMNDFLTKMGSAMRNIGGAFDCGSAPTNLVIPASSLRPHQVTAGLTHLKLGCASELQLSPTDYALFYDRSGTHVLGAVAKIAVER